jgi:hypothetical protein
MLGFRYYKEKFNFENINYIKLTIFKDNIQNSISFKNYYYINGTTIRTCFIETCYYECPYGYTSFFSNDTCSRKIYLKTVCIAIDENGDILPCFENSYGIYSNLLNIHDNFLTDIYLRSK